MMIDGKQFMEFFENTYNIKFVDAESGKSVLGMVSEQCPKICKNCRFIESGDGDLTHLDDLICCNNDSEFCADFRRSGDTCNCFMFKE